MGSVGGNGLGEGRGHGPNEKVSFLGPKVLKVWAELVLGRRLPNQRAHGKSETMATTALSRSRGECARPQLLELGVTSSG